MNSESRLSWRFSRNRGNGVQRDSRRVPILSVAILATVALVVAGCSSGSETDSTNTVTARQPPNIDIIAGARPESHHDRFLSNLQAMAAVDSDLFVRSTCDFRKTTRQLALKFRAKMAFSTAENNPPAVGQHCPSPWTRRDETVSNGATNEARGVRIHQCVDDRE